MAACARRFKAVLPTATNKIVEDLTVVTYNILADKYANSGHHNYCSSDDLKFSSRSPRLLDEVTKNYAADILCLQEVERNYMEDELGPKLRSLGHEWLYYGRQRTARDVPGPEDGVCLSYNTFRLEKLASMNIRFGDYAAKTLYSTNITGKSPSRSSSSIVDDTPLSKFLDFIKEREDGAVIALLRDRTQANQLFIAASTHLYWSPVHPDIKAAQATLLCAAIREFMEFQRVGPLPIILGGDFNSLPRKRYSDAFDTIPDGEELISGVYEILTNSGESLSPEHPHHPATRRRKSKNKPNNDDNNIKNGGGGGGEKFDGSLLKNIELNSKGFVLRSAAKEAWGTEPLFTNRTPGFTGCLDYIFFTPKHFQVSEILEMPFGSAADGNIEGNIEEASVLEQFPPIPNAIWPSDHLAIGAKLRWNL